MNEGNDYRDNLVIVGYFIASLVAIWSFLKITLTDDVSIFYGIAHLASMANNFPSAIDAVWEVKPIGNRIIWYFLYNLSSGDIFLAKIIVVIVTLIVAGYLATQVSKYMSYHLPGGLVTVSMFTLYNLCILQPEWFAVLGCFLALALILSDRFNFFGGNVAWFLSGVIMVGIIGIKGSTLFLVPSVFCAAYIFLAEIDWERIKYVASGVITGMILAGISILLWFPYAIGDMITGINIAHHATPVAVSWLDAPAYFIFCLAATIQMNPIVLIGEFSLIAMVVLGYYHSEDSRWFFLGMMWIFPIVGIIIQNEYFGYHYTVLIFPALMTLLFLIRYMPFNLKGATLLSALLIMFAIFFFVSSTWSPDQAVQTNFDAGVTHDADIANGVYNATRDQPVLYMDPGSAPYYVGATSYCRYVSPLSLQRHTGDIAETQTRDCIRGYEGNIIIGGHHNWRELTNDSVVAEKMTHYSKVYNGTLWDIYVRN